METDKNILKILLKDLKARTITYLAEETKITRTGVWKILKKLERKNLILLNRIGKGKTSTHIISLNWENPVLEKTLNLLLTEDALEQKRWISNFKDLENKVDFLIIYGSILKTNKANDIDLLGISKDNFTEIEKIIRKIQNTQIKKIHSINFTPEEFKRELKKNKAFIDAVKKGIILFGQEKFIKFMKNLKA